MRFDEGLDAAEVLISQQATASVTIVAVDGHSAAGKSAFADGLTQRVDASIVHGDDFYRVMDDSERERLTAKQGADRYYDWQRMRSEALTPLRSGCPATFHPYDWERNGLHDRTVTVEAAPVVIVEGLFVSRPELEDLVDLSVLVICPDDVRWRRQLERADAEEAWLLRWEAAERLFFHRTRPPDAFDIVISAEAP
jgi:uridine kinase